MRAPVSWLRDWAHLLADLDAEGLAAALVRVGLEVETVEHAGAGVRGPLVIGRVLGFTEETHPNGKTIRYCSVDVGPKRNGPDGSRGIVCGARNFAVGDLVVVALPGAVLPGGFAIAARQTYGHLSDGMICSARELGIGDDHAGILVVTPERGGEVRPGADAFAVLRLVDDVLDIAITPDRGYCWSVRGLAREAALALGGDFVDPVDRPVPDPVSDGYPVVVQSDACPVFVALTVRGLDPNHPSPRWLQRRIQLAGMRSISLPVDVTNYVMLETGQPLHAYDVDRLRGPIGVRKAEPGETLVTLDDVKRDLEPDDLVITDDSGPIGLAGVMGGASTELSADTTTLVLEAANFEALTIARTSRRHRLSSEASRRFERGVDPDAAYAAAHRAAALLVELAGGTLVPEETVIGRVPQPPSIQVDAGLPARILGVDVSDDRAADLIEAVGARVEREGGSLRLTPPTWRPDLRDPYDYVEEVGRLVGYDQIPSLVPVAPPGRGLTRSQRLRRAVNRALAGSGFVEVLTFPFTNETEIDQLGAPIGDERRRLVRIANPLAETSPYLRTTLLPGLFGAVTRNTSRSNDDLALFEQGVVFLDRGTGRMAPRLPVDHRPTPEELAELDAALPDQPRHLGVVLTGAWRPPRWDGVAEPASWQHAVAFVEVAARAVGVDLGRLAAARLPWHPRRCAEFRVRGTNELVGFAGELHPTVVAAYGLPTRTAAAEIDLDTLIAAAPVSGEVASVSSFPVVKEDVALVVDAAVPVAAVEAALRFGAGPLLESVRLFDLYTGPQIGEGKRSLAYALRFRAPDRTLTEAEAASARDAAVAAVATAVGAVQRA